MRWREMPGQRQWVLAARRRSGFRSVSCFGSEGNAGEFGSAFLVHAGHGMGAGLDNGLFKVAKHSYLGRGMCMAHTLMLARFTCCEF